MGKIFSFRVVSNILLFSLLFLFAFPAATSAALEGGTGSTPTPILPSSSSSGGSPATPVEGSAGDDEGGEERLPPCEVIEWSDEGGSFSCVAETDFCENTTGGGKCVATDIAAVLNGGYTVNVKNGSGEVVVVTKEKLPFIFTSGVSLPSIFSDNGFTGLINGSAQEDNSLSFLFSTGPLANTVPGSLFNVDENTIWGNVLSGGTRISSSLLGPGSLYSNLKDPLYGGFGSFSNSNTVEIEEFSGFTRNPISAPNGFISSGQIGQGLATLVSRLSERASSRVTPDNVIGWVENVAGVILGTPASTSAVGVRENNNPGNVVCGDNWRGSVGCSSQGFVIFDSPINGMRAGIINLANQANNHGIDTLSALITKYAPPATNNTAAYIAAVSRQLGIGPNERIDLTDPTTNLRVFTAIMQHENGGIPYTAEQVAQAYGLVDHGLSMSVGISDSQIEAELGVIGSGNIEDQLVSLFMGTAVEAMNSLMGSSNAGVGFGVGLSILNNLTGIMSGEITPEQAAQNFSGNVLGTFSEIGGMLAPFTGGVNLGEVAGGVLNSLLPQGITGVSTGVSPSMQFSDSEARGLLSDIEFKSGVSTEGIRAVTVGAIQQLDQTCGCNILITSVTDGRHAGGTFSHGEGYKFDVRTRDNPELVAFITQFPIVETWSDGTNVYQDPNNPSITYALESDHLDVRVTPDGGSVSIGSGGGLLGALNNWVDGVYDSFGITNPNGPSRGGSGGYGSSGGSGSGYYSSSSSSSGGSGSGSSSGGGGAPGTYVAEPSVTLLVYPLTIPRYLGGEVHVIWSSKDVDSCVVYGPGDSVISDGPADGDVPNVSIVENVEEVSIRVECVGTDGKNVTDEKKIILSSAIKTL